MSFWSDTLKPKGRYELKRAMAVNAFNFGTLYAFMPWIKPDFEVKEFVVWAFFGFAAGCIGIALNEKIKMGNSDGFANDNSTSTEQQNIG